MEPPLLRTIIVALIGSVTRHFQVTLLCLHNLSSSQSRKGCSGLQLTQQSLELQPPLPSATTIDISLMVTDQSTGNQGKASIRLTTSSMPAPGSCVLVKTSDVDTPAHLVRYEVLCSDWADTQSGRRKIYRNCSPARFAIPAASISLVIMIVATAWLAVVKQDFISQSFMGHWSRSAADASSKALEDELVVSAKNKEGPDGRKANSKKAKSSKGSKGKKAKSSKGSERSKGFPDPPPPGKKAKNSKRSKGGRRKIYRNCSPARFAIPAASISLVIMIVATAWLAVVKQDFISQSFMGHWSRSAADASSKALEDAGEEGRCARKRS
eukprot:g60053.t1